LLVAQRRAASPTLLKAQEKLAELRERIRHKDGHTSPSETAHGRRPANALNFHRISRHLPEHLGWGSQPLSNLLRATAECKAPLPSQDVAGEIGRQLGHGPEDPARPPAQSAASGQQTARPAPTRCGNEQHVKMYPDIALALLREQLVAPARLWLLLRFLDQGGRGWLEIEEARQKLTSKQAQLHVFGWRQMRKLLNSGEGLFWTKDDRRIWLRSPLKVAISLRLKRLHNRPVALPVSGLLQGIGLVRAHFYASFHSGRMSEKEAQAQSAPISRATLQAICKTSRRTLRQYEKRAGVQSRQNFAVGKPLAVADLQHQAWRRGRAVLPFTDRAGQLGRQGATYTAWQLPNSYRGPHKQRPKGRQKRMNRRLADLFMKGMTGNGKQADHRPKTTEFGSKCFFANGFSAAAKYNRQPDRDQYWPNQSRKRGPGNSGYRLWHWLPARHKSGNVKSDCGWPDGR